MIGRQWARLSQHNCQFSGLGSETAAAVAVLIRRPLLLSSKADLSGVADQNFTKQLTLFARVGLITHISMAYAIANYQEIWSGVIESESNKSKADCCV